jgi:endonuclease G
MVKKALCIGINDYPFDENDLQGCVADARAWAELLLNHYDFEREDVKLLLDSDATKENILGSLKEMVANSADGDIIVFTNSSHGTYLYDINGDEKDKYDEAICPYDINDNLIVDDELRELFEKLPAGVNLTVISDSCHSGTVLKAVVSGRPDKRRLRFLNPALINRKAYPDIRKAKPKSRMVNVDKSMNAILMSACKSNEYASEADINGEIRGAMTYYAIKLIEESGYKITLAELDKKLQAKLEAEDYNQQPQLEGREGNMKKYLFSNEYAEDEKPQESSVEVLTKSNMESKKDRINKDALQRFKQLEVARKGGREFMAKDACKMRARKSVINEYDGMALERILGKSDLFPIAHLQLGLNAGHPVCRISVRDRIGRVQGYGTGFMVSPNLLMTNNHVLDREETSLYSIAEFNYQDDEKYMPRPVVSFRLDPDRVFITDENLDFTLVAVTENPNTEIKISDFGFLKLLPQEGKIFEGEYVSVIQHPQGGPKAVSVRENEVKYLSPDFVHYLTDTEPGSSGSPVFNDQWVVVALHHAGVPDPDNSTKWIANEGVRISSIAAHLAEKRDNLDVNAKALIDELLSGATLPEHEDHVIEIGELDEEWYRGASGYNEGFLGEDFIVPVPTLKQDKESDVAVTKEGSKLLDYTHFSIAMSMTRRLAFYTAANIDGKSLISLSRGGDKWYYDPRIEKKFQSGESLYSKNDLDRGHLVRRLDPVWGADAEKANEDTFHFTNSSPQHKNLNQKTWLNLENYIINNAKNYNMKVTVFTGPVFRADDMIYRGEFRIPAEFWKVAVIVKDDGTLSATAYLQTQKNLIKNLEFAYGAYETYQVPVAQIEELAGLDFGKLREHDPIADIEAVGAFVIEGPESIRL